MAKGISVEIWQKVAAAENLEYELIRQENVGTIIEAVKGGQLDVGIGPISITSDRLKEVKFTQPFFVAKMGLLLPSQPPRLWNRIKPFFAVAFISSVGILLASLFVVGNLLWLAERGRNQEQFPQLLTGKIGSKAPSFEDGFFCGCHFLAFNVIIQMV